MPTETKPQRRHRAHVNNRNRTIVRKTERAAKMAVRGIR